MKCKCRKIKLKVAKKKKQSQNNGILVIHVPKLKDLEATINETVIGQEKIVKSICTKVYEGLCFPQLKNNILLVGKSGTGKTEIVRQLAENLHLPCSIEDATRYTEDGYVGASVTDMIENLISAANGNVELATRGIIFIDEIDKKASNKNEYNTEASREGVLKGLLKIIEGTDVFINNPNYSLWEFDEQVKMKVNTSNITFILGGAFEGLDKIREKRLKKQTQIGFTSMDVNHIAKTSYMNTSFTKQDLIEYGLPAELVGRISSIYETKNLEVEDLKQILKKSKKSEFRKYETIMKESGIELVYSPRIFDKIAKNSFNSSTGARELASQVSYMFEEIMYECFNTDMTKKYTKCVLENGIIDDNTKYHWET